MSRQKKYQRCLVMAGGGFRFGYYLGIYAAMCKLNKTPDLLLASCGGAIAAGAIQAFSNDAERKDWISSPAMYQFWLQLKSSQQASISQALLGAFRRRFFGKNAERIPDLFNNYLFEIPRELPCPVITSGASEPAVAIIAGKLLYTESEVGQLRGGRKLFAETVFTDNRTALLLQGACAPLSASGRGENAIAAQLLSHVDIPMEQAVRASVSDMFYFRCHSYQGADYIGGVIDLFPIEIAHQLANEVIMELKGPYDKLFALPALRVVLGIDGNLRLNQVLQQTADLWIDTSDMRQALNEYQIEKRINWKRNRVELLMPDSYENYVKMIDLQWQYGYQRGLSGSAKTSGN
jgi:predicted acylesterase/phospholipase RssA